MLPEINVIESSSVAAPTVDPGLNVDEYGLKASTRSNTYWKLYISNPKASHL